MNAREAAIKVLVDTEEKGAYSNIALNKILNGSELSPLDKGLATELVYGTLKNKILIDYYIAGFSKVKLKKISSWIINILRIGIYQLMFSDKIPVSAACNESVKLAKKYGHSASAGFVNAIMRNIARDRQKVKLPDKDKDPSLYFSVKYSHPKWIVDMLLSEHDIDFSESLLIANNEVPKLSIRTNTLKTNRDSLINILRDEGAAAEKSTIAPEGVTVEGLASPANSKVFSKGYFQVQDESSMLVARVLGPNPGEFVIDVCSAPGGKTTHIAQLMNNEGSILAFDIHPHKLDLVRENARRLGINIIETVEQDASIEINDLKEKADCVLVDAPCSGLGIIRRKPDIKWTRTQSDIKALKEIQRKILKVSSSYVKPQGTLVYSTCTILKAENIDTVDEFLSENQNFYIENVEGFIEEPLRKYVDSRGYLQLYPNIQGADGFFICRMKRK